MFKIYIDNGDGERDYTRYVVSQSVSISKSLNAPSTCSLSLQNADNIFRVPVPRSYIRVYSEKFQKNLYTGFLTNDPSASFVGLNRRVPDTNFQMYSFQCQFTSDEYLLNIKSVPFLPAFVNQTQGAILRSIAETLCPGYFDFTYCADGDLVPYMAYDPSKSWSQIAKSFGDASRFRYSVVDREIHYQPYGDGYLGISYDDTQAESTFDPGQLSAQAETTAIVNDVTIVGQQEAGNNRQDYFIGTGFNGVFPLNHKVFGLDTTQQGSGILLADEWTGDTLNTTNWNAQDPSNNFFYGVNGTSALNILTGVIQDEGTSYIIAQNGLELGGGVNMQHGEFNFNDICQGVIGGVYDSQVINGYGDYALDDSKCESGFLIESSHGVQVSASGAAGVTMKPFRYGIAPSGAFEVVSQINKSYTLYTRINAPKPTRFTQTYRSMAGIAYGNYDEPEVRGAITWSVVETDAWTGVQTVYTYTLADQVLPSNAIYALINNVQMNLTARQTQITTPIPGSLNVKCEVGAGTLGQIYISGNVQFTGGFVTPSGGNLPILPNMIGPEHAFALGTGINNQAAELDSGQVTDTLNFYSDDLPGVGTRIRLQTFESQAAVARIRDTASITRESAIVGDDGIRSSVVSNLAPPPRTSEDCEAAGIAFIADRVSTLWSGTYSANYNNFKNITNDIDFFPTCGRMLYINSPQRRMNKVYTLVSSISIKITELRNEILTYNISFGPDKQLEKLLAVMVPQPASVLTPIDTSILPTPQSLSTVGSYFLPDVHMSMINQNVSGAWVQIDLVDPIPEGAYYEVRNADLNWGQNDSRLIAAITDIGSYTFPRTAYDQSWYVRLVQKNTALGTISSRRTTVLRVQYPRVPAAPHITTADSSTLLFDFAGDVRDVEGIELRSGNGLSGFYQAIVGSQADMNLDLSTLRGQTLYNSITGNLGVHALMKIPANQRDFIARFFNLMWEFSPGVYVNIPPPKAPTVSLGYRFGASLQIKLAPTDKPARNDIKSSKLEVSKSFAFNTATVLVNVETNGNPGAFVVNVPVTGDLWARAQFADYVSSGAWSSILHIPQGTLIASDYMVGQGSVPPSITNTNTSGGGIFSYTATDTELILYSEGFDILWPNKVTDHVPATSGAYTECLDISGALIPLTNYGFFPKVTGPSTPTPKLVFNGPYQEYTGTLQSIACLSGQLQDGSVPMTNGAFVCQTAPAAYVDDGGQVGGGGGGTYGGDTCGAEWALIELSDGYFRTLQQLNVGEIVRTRSGKFGKVVYIRRENAEIYVLKTKSGRETQCASAHTFYSSDEWKTLDMLVEELLVGDHVAVQCVDGSYDEVVSIAQAGSAKIVRIELEEGSSDDDHVYALDGFWNHNIMFKDQTP